MVGAIDGDDIDDERFKHLNKFCLLSWIIIKKDMFSATEMLIVW